MTGKYRLTSALAAAASTALSVAINIATGQESNWITWLAVVALTAVGWGVGMMINRTRQSTSDRLGDETSDETRAHNSDSQQVSVGNPGVSLQAGHDIKVGGQLSARLIVALGSVVLLAVVLGLAARGIWGDRARSLDGSASAATAGVPSAGAAASAPKSRPPALAIAKAWPFVSGCPTVGAVAMPPGMGNIGDFHATTDIRGKLTSSGAGSWTRGALYLDLSTDSNQPVDVINIQPHIDRRDLAPPAWIYKPDDGCGPYGSDRIFNFSLDAPEFADKGLYVSEAGVSPEADMPATPLGPDFSVSSTKHARIRVNATSCRGNYEWSLDVQFVPPGGTNVEHVGVGPFQSYGVANNTKVYEGYQGSTGSVRVDRETTLTGSDPVLSKTEPEDPFFKC